MRTRVPAAVRSVAVWLNVFIPAHVLGATVTVHGGPYAGRTALDLGSVLLLTDQRAFSRDPGAASRMHSHVAIEVSGREPVVTIRHRADRAITCDRSTGEEICRARTSVRRMGARVVSRDPMVVTLDCATSCPCPGVPHGLATLEYRGTITYRPALRALSVDLMVGQFPATEGYASVNDEAGAILFRQAPLPIEVSRAPGGAHRRIRSAFTDGDSSGFFPASDPIRARARTPGSTGSRPRRAGPPRARNPSGRPRPGTPAAPSS